MTLEAWWHRERKAGTYLKMEQVAELLGISISFFSLLKDAKRTPKPPLAMKIEKLTRGEVTAADLLGLKGRR